MRSPSALMTLFILSIVIGATIMTEPYSAASKASEGDQRPERRAATHTILHASSTSFIPAHLENAIAAEPSAENGYSLLMLAPGNRSGTVTSQELAPLFPFDELVASWNAWTPAGSSITVQARVRLSGDSWSGWYTLGIWSGIQGNASAGRSLRGQKDVHGRVEIDTLVLNQPASAFQYRVLFESGDADSQPGIRLVAVNYTDTRQPLRGDAPPLSSNWARDLPVPQRSQAIEDPEIRWQICSPTSTGMVLSYFERSVTTLQACSGVYDNSGGNLRYGNWVLNTAYASTQRMEAYVDRFYHIDQLKNEIAAGRPVIISMNFTPGQLDNSPLTKTAGHIVVVRGFTADGSVIVNDPAAPDNAGVRRIYRADQLANVWINNAGGIVYRMQPLNTAP